MTQEEKQLLLQDISARLLYGVKISKVIDEYISENTLIKSLYKDGSIVIENEPFDDGLPDIEVWDVSEIKPYLRPMSSMTDEEKREIYDWLVENDVDWFDFSKLRLHEILISFDSSWLLINWLNEHKFDYNGLIEKGLALEAPEGMYK